MKIIIAFIVIISLVTCEPVPHISQIAKVEDDFIEIRKNILLCISANKNATEGLRKYATEHLDLGSKKTLNFYEYREKESDYNIIRECRRKAIVFPIKKHINLPNPLASKDNVVPK